MRSLAPTFLAAQLTLIHMKSGKDVEIFGANLFMDQLEILKEVKVLAETATLGCYMLQPALSTSICTLPPTGELSYINAFTCRAVW